MNITINHRKIIKYINKHPNIDFKSLSKKFNPDMLKVELFNLWSNDYIESSRGNNIENSSFSICPLGSSIVSEDYFTSLERFKDRFIGFVFGLLTAFIIHVFTKYLI